MERKTILFWSNHLADKVLKQQQSTALKYLNVYFWLVLLWEIAKVIKHFCAHIFHNYSVQLFITMRRLFSKGDKLCDVQGKKSFFVPECKKYQKLIYDTTVVFV